LPTEELKLYFGSAAQRNFLEVARKILFPRNEHFCNFSKRGSNELYFGLPRSVKCATCILFSRAAKIFEFANKQLKLIGFCSAESFCNLPTKATQIDSILVLRSENFRICHCILFCRSAKNFAIW
jgi:hypothetical protein